MMRKSNSNMIEDIELLEIEKVIAKTILQGANAMYGSFLDITSGAQDRFEKEDWPEVQNALKKRIKIYDQHVKFVTYQLKLLLKNTKINNSLLINVKKAYESELLGFCRFDIAESFFNSVYCLIFSYQKIKEHRFFIKSQTKLEIKSYPQVTKKYYFSSGNYHNIFTNIISDYAFTLKWENKEKNISDIVTRLSIESSYEDSYIEMITEPFYRNKAAYLVGKISHNKKTIPLVIPILINNKKKLFVDTIITKSSDISIIFGFARSYFMVYAPIPHLIVGFLSTLMPQKTKAELYTSIGCQKHGKTELYREFYNHINSHDDKFIVAPGTKGMVMLVFTLPSYDFVFKLIRDKFAHQKQITKTTVKEKYKLVKEHDRVGRMADTQEYSNFLIPKNKFNKELLEQLLHDTSNIVKEVGDNLLIKHLYMERRMTPLNLYLSEESGKNIEKVIYDYGLAIKQLAAANIFPGDMLFKNFGLTRHNRVIFYDYDEISYMTEVNFREIPKTRTYEDELQSEPWFSVSDNDVFPEEFATFLLRNNEVKKIFVKHHPELLTTTYWKQLQKNILLGNFEDVFPYDERVRFNQN